MSKLTIEDLFISWKVKVKNRLEKARFTKTVRQEIIDELCEDFFKHGIDFEDAKFFQKKIQQFLVTREGQKGNGRYKGWMDNVKEDYIATLTAYYEGEFEPVNDTTHVNKSTKVNEFYGGRDYLDRTPLIVAWTKHKYSERWTEAICLEAHRVFSPLWNMFMKEVIYSKWAKSGERPDWAENIY